MATPLIREVTLAIPPRPDFPFLYFYIKYELDTVDTVDTSRKNRGGFLTTDKYQVDTVDTSRKNRGDYRKQNQGYGFYSV